MQFQVPQNQQKSSDHDRLMTSNASCHNFQTISNFCTADFQIMEKPKKRYIIRAYTQGSDLTGPESAGIARRSRETTWEKQFSEISDNSNILWERICEPSFYGNWQLICALSRLSRPLPEYLFTEADGNLPTFFQRFQRIERIGAGSSNAFNANQKAEISDLTAFSAEKSQIHNIKLRFHNI